MAEEKVNYLIIDTREPSEFARSHVEGAINVSSMEFMSGGVPAKLKEVDKDQPIILYCLSGQRSNTCAMLLKQYGFTHLTNGINESQTRRLLSRT
jgi:phage shock protein E